VPQASVTEAVPNAAAIAADDGLHANVPAVVTVMVGGVRSLVHVIVDEAVAVLPQASVAVNVLVCEFKQPLD
jgi:hypothetical protein